MKMGKLSGWKRAGSATSNQPTTCRSTVQSPCQRANERRGARPAGTGRVSRGLETCVATIPTTAPVSQRTKEHINWRGTRRFCRLSLADRITSGNNDTCQCASGLMIDSRSTVSTASASAVQDSGLCHKLHEMVATKLLECTPAGAPPAGQSTRPP